MCFYMYFYRVVIFFWVVVLWSDYVKVKMWFRVIRIVFIFIMIVGFGSRLEVVGVIWGGLVWGFEEFGGEEDFFDWFVY